MEIRRTGSDLGITALPVFEHLVKLNLNLINLIMNNCKLIPIRSIINASTDEPFQKELILRQVKKILSHPLFIRSGILRRFLLYIIQETLSGRTNTLKEYTIAIGVLKKPVDFNPKNNCIVRIHAARLRNRLTNYYQETNQDNDLIISVPKGSYIPSFQRGRRDKSI